MISSQIKFDYFFESIREFTLSLGLVLIDNENQNPSIGTGGVLNGKLLSISIASYLTRYSSNINFINNGFGGALFDISTILKCQQIAKENQISDDIIKLSTISGRKDRKQKFEKNSLLFLKYDTLGSSYLFVENQKDNPILYVFWEGGEITTVDMIFTSYIREIIFWELIRIVQSSADEICLKINNIPWLKFYSWFYQNHKNPRNKLIAWRYEFNRFLEKNKIEEESLLEVDEFEVEFIKYLIEYRDIENVKYVFDPYTTLITYEDYLNS